MLKLQISHQCQHLVSMQEAACEYVERRKVRVWWVKVHFFFTASTVRAELSDSVSLQRRESAGAFSVEAHFWPFLRDSVCGCLCCSSAGGSTYRIDLEVFACFLTLREEQEKSAEANFKSKQTQMSASHLFKSVLKRHSHAYKYIAIIIYHCVCSSCPTGHEEILS